MSLKFDEIDHHHHRNRQMYCPRLWTIEMKQRKSQRNAWNALNSIYDRLYVQEANIIDFVTVFELFYISHVQLFKTQTST